jgi:parvulin-like peptidyl-prolyl isomerase
VSERWAHGEEIKKLLALSDGESRNRAGEGVGELRGDIRPPELEPYLFAMKDGEIAPPVELATGVHVFSVAKREYTGIKPFNGEVQKQIEIKLKNEVVDRERRPICQQLREEASIVIESKFP